MLVIILVFLASLTDLAPGNDEIYEEKQETFLTVGNPQDGQVVLYKVGTSSPHVKYCILSDGFLCFEIITVGKISLLYHILRHPAMPSLILKEPK